MSRTRKLDAVEIRVLGALLEKEQTTPEQYPLTANAVIAACNQKTNRDPVTHFTETEVVEALDRLFEDVLVWRSHGARSERWQHSLDRRWGLDKKSKAIMTLLLLRGPQTAGELRTRGERMYAFASVAEVEGTLAKLADGFDALVCELPRQPGQRETRWVHLESAEGDHRELEATAPPPRVAEPRPAEAGEVAGGRRSPYDERLESLESTVQGLQDTVSGLESTLATLQATVAAIDSKLRALSVDLGVE
jgi:hypothetical protein